MLIFLALILVVVGVGQWYLCSRLVRATTRPRSTARRVGTVLMIVLAFLPLSAVGVQRLDLPEAVGLPITWVGYIWLALMLYLFLSLLVLEIPRAVVRRRELRTPAHALVAGGAEPTAEPPTPVGPSESELTRRRAIARGFALTAGVVAVGTVGFGVRSALGPIAYRRTTIGLDTLPSELSGLKIAVISDLHVGEINGRDFVARVVDQVNSQQPDLVAICGDLVDGSVAARGEMVGPLQELESRFGSYFVTGNHEYFSGAEEWIEYLPDLDVTVLHNEHVTLGSGTATIDLAGVDDESAASSGQTGQGANYRKALAGRDTSRPVILMAHQPVQVSHAEQYGVDLQLSGHTHGGQLWPFQGVIKLQQGYVAGLYRVGGTQLYVTRGAGFWGPPVRVGAPPDISILTLQPKG